jgi:hypothetical protein
MISVFLILPSGQANLYCWSVSSVSLLFTSLCQSQFDVPLVMSVVMSGQCGFESVWSGLCVFESGWTAFQCGCYAVRLGFCAATMYCTLGSETICIFLLCVI